MFYPEGGLQHLKRLNVPTTDYKEIGLHNYHASTLMTTDRLEIILVSYDFFSEGSNSVFNHLCKNLYLFDKLAEIEVNMKTDDQIKELDNIIQLCKPLNKVVLDIQPREYTYVNKNLTFDAIQAFVPTPEIKTLVNETQGLHDEKILLYIMHKFPQLDHLVLKFSKESYSSYKLTQQTLTQILRFLSNVDKFDVSGFKLDHNTIINAIKSYWNEPADLGITNVNLLYSGFCQMEILDISNTSVDINSSLMNTDWKHIAFLKENGHFLGSLSFTITVDQFESIKNNVLPSSFISNALNFCPHLKNLSIGKCILRPSASPITLNEKFALDSLCLKRYATYTGVLEQWSLLLSDINQVVLRRNTLYKR